MHSAAPQGWRNVTLGQVASVRRDAVVPSLNGDARYVALEHIAQGSPRLLGWSASAAATSNKTRFRAGDVLFGKLRPHLRKSVRVDFDGVCSTDILAIVAASDLDPAYLGLLCQSRRLQEHAVATSIGTKMPRTTWQQLSAFRMALPSLPEQRTIASAVSCFDETIERTEAVIARAIEAKQALAHELLTHGLPGRHTRFKQTPAGEIPECWEFVHFGELIADGPTNGLYKHESEYGDGTRIVRVDDFYGGRFVTLKALKRVRATAAETNTFALTGGQILINRVNSLPFLGKCALVPQLDEPTVYESNMMRLDTDARRLLPDYAVEWLCTREAVRQIQARAKKAVAQASISQGDVRDLLLPLPPLREQQAAMGLLGAAEERINLERQDLERRRSAKERLALALLTGEVRVPKVAND